MFSLVIPGQVFYQFLSRNWKLIWYLLYKYTNSGQLTVNVYIKEKREIMSGLSKRLRAKNS